MKDLTDLILNIFILRKHLQDLRELYKASDTNSPFEGKLLLAETYWYNWSGWQDSNLRPSAPKELTTQIATVSQINKWGYSLLVAIKRKFMSLKK